MIQTVLIFLMVHRVASYNLNITPEHSTTSSYVTELRVTCTADFPIVGCQFTLLAKSQDGRHWTDAAPRLDLCQGLLTQANRSLFTDQLGNYRYNGRGLEAGECGVLLLTYGWKDRLVGCRVRALNSGWVYAWTDLLTSYGSPLEHTVTPREVVALPGAETTFLVKSKTPIHECSFHLPGRDDHIAYNSGVKVDHTGDGHRFHGAGLVAGECGLVLSNVTEGDQGMARLQLHHSELPSNDALFIPIILASAPSRPVLITDYEGQHLTGTCTVQESRPRANMTWLLGDDVIRQDSLDDSPANLEDMWRWPWTKVSMMQKVKLALQPIHAGKVLKCVVSHVALVQPLVAADTITFSKINRNDDIEYRVNQSETPNTNHPRTMSNNLKISPERLLTNQNSTMFTVTCNFDFTITGCQFTWLAKQIYRRLEFKSGPRLDLSGGTMSKVNPSLFSEDLVGYSYSGRGLEAGDCGVRLTKEGSSAWLVGCRVRGVSGGWVYAWMDVHHQTNFPIPHKVTPKEVVAIPGGEATFTIKGQSLASCELNLPGVSHTIEFHTGSKRNITHRYQRVGSRRGECGLKLNHVTEADNGLAHSYIAGFVAQRSGDSCFIPITIASAPSRPVLSTDYEGQHLTGTCTVQESRPRANMTWLLGDDVIRQDSLDDSPANLEDMWRWPWTKVSMMQKVKLTLQPIHAGKVLKCVVSHVTLVKPLVATETIAVNRINQNNEI